MKSIRYILPALLLLCLAACVNDDTDMSKIIDGSGGDTDTIKPVDIELDFTALDEIPDTPPTDVLDPDYNDYEENSPWDYTINIAYDGEQATLSGNTNRVRYTTDGAHVTINSTSSRINYVITGTSSNGSLKIYSESKFKLTLNGVSLTNPTGAPINNQCGKSLYLVLADGTTNTLADGTAYTDVVGEDQKGTLFSEGQILLSGKGTLNVNANVRHAFVSDDYLRIRPGAKLNITSAAGHGIKVNDGIYIDGGVLNITTSGNGYKAIKCDSFVAFNGGRTTLLTSGGCSITPATDIAPADTSSCAGIKADSIMTVNGGILRIKSTGEGGKGINTGYNLTINAGSITIVTTGVKGLAAPKGIKSDASVIINGGYIYSYSAASDPLDGNLGVTIAPGYNLYESLSRRLILAY